MAENLGEGRVKLTVQDDTAKGVNSATESVSKFGKGVAAVKGLFSQLLLPVALASGILRFARSLMDAKDNAAALRKELGAVAEASSRAASKFITAVNPDLTDLEKQIAGIRSERDADIQATTEKYKSQGESLLRTLDRSTGSFFGSLSEKQMRIFLKADLEEISMAAKAKEDALIRVDEIARKKKAEADAKTEHEKKIAALASQNDFAAEVQEHLDRMQDEEIKAAENVHALRMQHVEEERRERLATVNALIAAEDRLRGMQSAQTAGFGVTSGSMSIDGIQNAVNRIERKINYSVGRRNW